MVGGEVGHTRGDMKGLGGDLGGMFFFLPIMVSDRFWHNLSFG